MNEKEIMKWAVKGIEEEMKKLDKKLKRDYLLMQSFRKGINENLNHEKVEKRIKEGHEQYELLHRKKAFLLVQLEEKGGN